MDKVPENLLNRQFPQRRFIDLELAEQDIPGRLQAFSLLGRAFLI